eukprot:Nk52_evm1s2311 gene=Nk52_evmTU1s2311
MLKAWVTARVQVLAAGLSIFRSPIVNRAGGRCCRFAIELQAYPCQGLFFRRGTCGLSTSPFPKSSLSTYGVKNGANVSFQGFQVLISNIRYSGTAARARPLSIGSCWSAPISRLMSTGAAAGSEAPKKSLTQRFSAVVKEYGIIATSFHSSIFLFTLGGLTVAVSSMSKEAETFTYIKKSVKDRLGEYDEYYDQHSGSDWWLNLTMAYFLTLATGPARLLLTIVSTPIVARLLRA